MIIGKYKLQKQKSVSKKRLTIFAWKATMNSSLLALPNRLLA